MHCHRENERGYTYWKHENDFTAINLAIECSWSVMLHCVQSGKAFISRDQASPFRVASHFEIIEFILDHSHTFLFSVFYLIPLISIIYCFAL